MTINTSTNVVVCLGNGATNPFSYSFLIPLAADAVVIYTDATGLSTTLISAQYSISGIGNPAGGTVTYPIVGSPIATGTTLTIARIVPLTQTTSLSNQGNQYPAATEGALDYLMMAVQQVSGAVGRGLTAPIVDATPPGPLPSIAARAGLILGFDSSGNPIATTPVSAPVSTVMQPVIASTTVAAALALMGGAPLASPALTGNPTAPTASSGDNDTSIATTAFVAANSELATFTPTGTGAVARTIRSKFRDMVSVKDFGAVGDNATDDTAAIQLAITAQIGAVYFPPGTYLCTAALKVYNETALYGFGGTPGTTVAGMSRLRFTGTGTACLTQNNLAASVQHGCIRDLAFFADTGSTYSWIFDFEDILGWTFSGIGAVNNNTAGGVFRGRQLVAGDSNWINRMYDCEFAAPTSGTAYVMDVTWTDSQILGCNFDGAQGAIVRPAGNVEFIGCQFNRAVSGKAGATVSKETASATFVAFVGCAFDANVTTGLTLDATSSPSGSVMAVTVNACNFRNPSGTQDILCVDGPLLLSGISVVGCKFTDATVTTGVTFNAAKWQIDFDGANYFASGWKIPARTFTPAITFGGAAVGVTYTTQTGFYMIKGNVVTFDLAITLSAKGSSVGSLVVNNLPVAAAQQTPACVGLFSGFTGLTGALSAQISGNGIIISQTGAAATANVADTAATNSMAFRISGSYLTA